jgi:hypothetical protein
MRDRNLTFNCQWDGCDRRSQLLRKSLSNLEGNDRRVRARRFRQGIEERPISAHSFRIDVDQQESNFRSK